MQVASIQLEVQEGESKESRISHADKMIDLSVEKANDSSNLDLVLLPELWNVGFFEFERYKKESEEIQGKTFSFLANKAFEHDIYIYGGTIVEKAGNELFNTALFIGPNGNLLASYRKIHIFSYFGSKEGEYITPGDKPIVVKTELANFGLSTCYDLRFPEVYRQEMQKGAEVFLVTSCWSFPRVENWVALNQVRATENVAYLISCNATGNVRGHMHLGHSMIVDPWGLPIASSGSKEDIIMADINLQEIEDARNRFPALNDITLI
ncbi:MAG: nitrilase-related carbon-nitrogen hydrolase [Bacillota bacterium]